MHIDTLTITGIAGFAAALLVFCGSVFLLLALVMGARLAYFVTASVTLAFVLIMTVVWSFGTVPLGPVGQFGKPVAQAIPHWEPIDMDQEPASLDFAPAADYPEGDWHEPDPNDEHEKTIAGELLNAAGDFLEEKIGESEDGRALGYEDAGDATPVDDSVRLIERDGDEYGMAKLEPTPVVVSTEGAEASVTTEEPGPDLYFVGRFEPGNQFGKARMMAAGAFILFVLHLFGLSRAERRAKAEREENNNNG